MAGITKRYWFGEAILGGFFLVVLVIAAVLTPSTEALTLFGVEVPVMCGFRQATGYGCPGCGLTRSFTFMAHGDLFSAFDMNLLGPFLFLAFATQPPYRLFRALQDIRRNGFLSESK